MGAERLDDDDDDGDDERQRTFLKER